MKWVEFVRNLIILQFGNYMYASKPIQIDLQAILKERLGKRSRYVPSFLVRGVERLIHQDGLNGLLKHNFPKRGADFCDGVLADLNVRLDVRGEENMPSDSRCIIASNHPLGGLDGISMISWASRHYGKPVHFVVNDLLMAVEPLTDCFVPVNKHGSQSRNAARCLDAALERDHPVVIYPAGLCSRRMDDGSIADLRWNKMFINKAIESRRPIVPVHFEGHNSPSFYRLARMRQKSGLKFNFEMVLLPREVFRSAGSTFTLTVGRPISWENLVGADANAKAAEIRETVYTLPHLYE